MAKLVLVESLVSYRIRNVIEIADDAPKEWAEETVLDSESNALDDFSSVHIGDNIISSRIITEEEYLRIFDEDNEYLAEWSVEKKKKYIFKENE
jgi:hypothetical protein